MARGQKEVQRLRGVEAAKRRVEEELREAEGLWAHTQATLQKSIDALKQRNDELQSELVRVL